jgi:hypothetical protein
MPRQPRLDAPDTLHHVMVRGLERRAQTLILDEAGHPEASASRSYSASDPTSVMTSTSRVGRTSGAAGSVKRRPVAQPPRKTIRSVRTRGRCLVPCASRGCTEDEGRPFGVALQGEAPNRHERLGSKAPGVSVMEKAGAPVRWGLER